MANKAQIYNPPPEDADPKLKEHYDIIAPLLEIRRQYSIEASELSYELSNILGEDIAIGRVKGWFRVRSPQKRSPSFRVIRVMNQALLNILTKRGYKFSIGARLYYEIAEPFEKTTFEKEILKQNLKFRTEISNYKEKELEKKSMS